MTELAPLRDQLFFGTLACFFRPVEGAAYLATSQTLQEFGSGEALEVAKLTANERIQPVQEGDTLLLLDALPVADLSIRRFPVQPTNTEWPYVLHSPLLKCPSAGLSGLVSGHRSALIPCAVTGRWYRLKGCGNDNDGFPIVPALDDNGQPLLHSDGRVLSKIRGAAYVHTATRELHASAVVAQNCGGCANKPLGWWEYSLPTKPVPSIVRCCGVFETFGDRRLADHVLRGLEQLLPSLVRRGTAATTKAGAPLAFPNSPFGGERPNSDGWTSEMNQTHLVVVGGGGLSCSLESLLNIANTPLSGLTAPARKSFPQNALPQLREVWDECVDRLVSVDFNEVSGSGSGSLLGYLYWQFGWETGTFCRRLRAADMSWGTYRDGTGFHCNAHGNNMVLVQEGASLPTEFSRGFLLPLDFDMAYDRRTCTFLNRDSEQAFQEHCDLEAVSMARDLGCAPDSTGTQNNHHVEPQCEGLRWALRDTMVHAFLSAFRGEPNICPPQEALRACAYSLLRLALIQTSGLVA
eukprot:NODE_921_length_1823_cov_13.245772_g811_i0.p1 GENE.NODE_921_length_1823_cov_13.245772_g811_i0~~NODE_921_length_1823_cov_13.245772_g811_i0.p1  ORF type:complete len:522 (+),score=58.25 NODE_921_length_1823_cov_13.245772_g811_i0:158-1723(+)